MDAVAGIFSVAAAGAIGTPSQTTVPINHQAVNTFQESAVNTERLDSTKRDESRSRG